MATGALVFLGGLIAIVAVMSNFSLHKIDEGERKQQTVQFIHVLCFRSRGSLLQGKLQMKSSYPGTG